MLRWFGHVERVDEGRWPRKVKAAKLEGRLGIGKPRFGWLDGVKNGISYQGGKLAGGNATRKRKECVERTCEGVIVLTQSKESRWFILYEQMATLGWLYL